MPAARERRSVTMSMFDNILGNLGNLGNIEELAARVGVTPEQFHNLSQSLQTQIAGGADHAQALQQTAAEHGVSLESLQGVFGQGGALGGLGSMLDRDGDGNPLNDLGNLFNRS
jgi:hypothetical protein